MVRKIVVDISEAVMMASEKAEMVQPSISFAEEMNWSYTAPVGAVLAALDSNNLKVDHLTTQASEQFGENWALNIDSAFIPLNATTLGFYQVCKTTVRDVSSLHLRV